MTQLDSGNPDRDLMRHLLDWQVTHRSVAEIRGLVVRSRFGSVPLEATLDRWQVSSLIRLAKH